MEEVAKKYKGKAEFLFIYCREQHPDGERGQQARTLKNQPIPQAKSLEEWKKTAQQFCEDLRMTRRILVDEFDGKSVQRKYGGLPNPTVVVDINGKIALKMPSTNGKLLDDFLNRFLAGGGKLDFRLARSVPTAGQGGGGNPLDIVRMFEGLELTKAETKVAKQALRDKMEMRGQLHQKNHALRELAQSKEATEEEILKATKDYEAAVAAYHLKAAALDRELRTKISAKARAQLLTAGIIENGLGFMGPPMPQPKRR